MARVAGWLVHRFILFLAGQALVAAVYWQLGESRPWTASVSWWPVTIIAANVVSLGWQSRLAARVGLRWRDSLSADFRRGQVGKDLLTVAGVLLVSVPVAMVPNIGLAQWLFGSQEAALEVFVRPLPLWAALASLVLFPLTQGLAELPAYFAYALPWLRARGSQGLAVAVTACWLAAQHAAAPFVPDWRFIFWRTAMFLPFALWLGFVLLRRPRLLPYLMVVHVLIDLPVAAMVWQASAN